MDLPLEVSKTFLHCKVGSCQQLSGNRGFPTNSHWGKGWPDMGFRGTLPAFDGRNPSSFNWSIHITMGQWYTSMDGHQISSFSHTFSLWTGYFPPCSSCFPAFFGKYEIIISLPLVSYEISIHFLHPYWPCCCRNKTTPCSATRWRRTATRRARRPLRPWAAAFSVASGRTVLLQVSAGWRKDPPFSMGKSTGEHTKNYGKSPFLMGKLTIYRWSFENSYVAVYQRVNPLFLWQYFPMKYGAFLFQFSTRNGHFQ